MCSDVISVPQILGSYCFSFLALKKNMIQNCGFISGSQRRLICHVAESSFRSSPHTDFTVLANISISTAGLFNCKASGLHAVGHMPQGCMPSKLLGPTPCTVSLPCKYYCHAGKLLAPLPLLHQQHNHPPTSTPLVWVGKPRAHTPPLPPLPLPWHPFPTASAAVWAARLLGPLWPCFPALETLAATAAAEVMGVVAGSWEHPACRLPVGQSCSRGTACSNLTVLLGSKLADCLLVYIQENAHKNQLLNLLTFKCGMQCVTKTQNVSHEVITQNS